MCRHEAAELLRGYAPIGSTLEEALTYAEQETRPGSRDRVRQAAQLLGLRP